MSLYVPTKLQQQIRRQFKDCCAYCQTAEALIATTFEIEHITPQSAGGLTIRINLCLACPHCNRHKATRQSFVDPETQQRVPLFHPQQQVWQEHFAWDEKFSTVIGLTATGRATLEALEINRPALVRLRILWHKFGEHPPK
jgi:hypothetical protein